MSGSVVYAAGIGVYECFVRMLFVEFGDVTVLSMFELASGSGSRSCVCLVLLAWVGVEDCFCASENVLVVPVIRGYFLRCPGCIVGGSVSDLG